MTGGDTALRRIAEARGRVERATALWAPGDLSRIADCRDALLESVRELRDLESLFQQSVDSAFGMGVFNSASAAAGIYAAKIRAGLLALKNETARLEHLVDSASAFVRGALLLRGASTPVYTAHGSIQPDIVSTVRQGTQG